MVPFRLLRRYEEKATSAIAGTSKELISGRKRPLLHIHFDRLPSDTVNTGLFFSGCARSVT